jgi:hypothetical protein
VLLVRGEDGADAPAVPPCTTSRSHRLTTRFAVSRSTRAVKAAHSTDVVAKLSIHRALLLGILRVPVCDILATGNR